MLNDYIQHYGLMREMLPNGRREPAGPQHSWNTDTPLCNLLVFNVQRHSHHHEAPMLAYQYLKDLPDAAAVADGLFRHDAHRPDTPAVFHLMDPRVVAGCRWPHASGSIPAGTATVGSSVCSRPTPAVCRGRRLPRARAVCTLSLLGRSSRMVSVCAEHFHAPSCLTMCSYRRSADPSSCP
jgi:hypothetical protein